MYNPEITKLINRNLRLGLAVAALIKEFDKAQNIAMLEKAEQIQAEITETQKAIDMWRGEQ